MDVVAEERMVARFADGRATQIALRIGRPSLHPEGEWVCPIQVEGIGVLQTPVDIHGDSPLHAIVLGIGFLRFMLLAEVGRGIGFQGVDSDESMDLRILFGDMLWKVGTGESDGGPVTDSVADGR